MLTNKELETETVAGLIAKNWKITSDGPAGTQMQGPKEMGWLDKGCLIVGVLTVWFGGIGFLFIGIAMIDYLFLTKGQIVFFPKQQSVESVDEISN